MRARVSALAQTSLEESGVTVLTGHQAIKVSDGVVHTKHEGGEAEIGYDVLIVAVGRAARLTGYGLEELGIDTSKTFKLHSNWLGPYDFDSEERSNYTLLSQAKDIYGGSLTSIEVVQFKGDGTIRFLYPKNQQPLSLSKEDVISQLTGSFDINKEQLYTQRFLGRGHTQQLTKGKAQIQGDTLHLIEKMNGFNMHSQYVVLKSEADH